MHTLLDKILPMPLNLQFFADAEPPADEPPAGTSGNEGGEATSPEADKPSKPADLGTLLKTDKALQSQFDKLVSKALETARGNWQKEQTMTAEQLAEKQAQEQAAKLAARETALARRERRASAVELLGQKGLPVTLVDCVALDDDDMMQSTLEQTEKAFRASVDAAVKDKLKGAPPKDGGTEENTLLASARKAMGLK